MLVSPSCQGPQAVGTLPKWKGLKLKWTLSEDRITSSSPEDLAVRTRFFKLVDNSDLIR